MLEKFLPSTINTLKSSPIEKQEVEELEKNIRRERNGLISENLEGDPALLTPEILENGLEEIRKRGEKKSFQERIVSWVRDNAKIEKLPEDVLCIHATMHRNTGIGHPANMATYDQTWDKRMLQALNPNNLLRMPHAELSASLVKLGDFKDSQIWSQVGLIVCQGDIKESSTCDANSKYIPATQQRVGRTFFGGGYQRTQLKSGRPLTFSPDRYEIVDKETLKALRDGDEIQDTDPLLLKRNIKDAVKACKEGNHPTTEMIVKNPKFSAAFYTIMTDENLIEDTRRRRNLSFSAHTSFQRFKEFTEEYDIPMVFNKGGRFYAPEIKKASNKILTFREADGKETSYLEKPFSENSDTFFYSHKKHSHRKLPVLPENPPGILIQTKETTVQMISLGEDITDTVKNLPPYIPNDSVRNMTNAYEVSEIHRQEYKKERIERETKERIRKNIQDIIYYTKIINTSQYNTEKYLIDNITKVIDQGIYDLDTNINDRRVFEMLHDRLLSLKQTILDHKMDIEIICEKEGEDFLDFIRFTENIFNSSMST